MMETKQLWFGIDGGGTRSRIALVDDKLHMVAYAEGASTNIYSVTSEQVGRNLQEIITQACTMVGIRREELQGGCIGSAGLGRKKEIDWYRSIITSILGDSVPVALCTDGEILLCGGLGSLEGFCLISGTGSLALGRSSDGQLIRAGGWGYRLGDEGSAWWIGHMAIVRSLRSMEGRDIPTTLLDHIIREFGLAGVEDLVEFIHHRSTKAQEASIAPLVTSLAQNGDTLALRILHEAAEELVALIGSVIERMPPIVKKELVLAGGVFDHDRIVRNRFLEKFRLRYPLFTIIEPKGSALDGACRLAFEH